MKRLIFFILLVFLMLGCIYNNDTTEDSYSKYKPILMDSIQFYNSIHQYQATELDTIGKIAKLGDYLLVLEVYKGLHVLELNDMQNLSFLVIPGIIDFETNGEYIYVNSATDLVTLRFNSPDDIEEVDRQKNVFYELLPPDNHYANPTFILGRRPEGTVVVGWTLEREFESADTLIMPYYLFAKYDDYLYTNLGDNVLVFDISNNVPVYLTAFQANSNFIDKTYVFGNYLYTLSLANMAIFSLDDPQNPALIKQYQGINSGSYLYAEYTPDVLLYITYHVSSNYWISGSSFQIYDLGAFSQTALVKAVGMNYPLDLYKADSLIYICDGGLKVYSFSDSTLEQVAQYDDNAMNLYIVDSLIFALSNNMIYQYRLGDSNKLLLKSSVNTNYLWTRRF